MKQRVTKAVILVGGWGTRLRPLTYTLPKPLISFCNKPILKYQIEKLVKIGVNEIILALNYYSEMIMAEVNKYRDEFGIKIIYSKEDTPLGTAGPLALCREYLKDCSFFLLNSDICCNADLEEMKRVYIENENSLGTILSYSVSDPTKYGLLEVEDTKLISFIEKPSKIEGNGPWLINAGMYILSSEILPRIQLKETSIEKEIFPELAQEGRLTTYTFEGYWMDIGQPKDYLVGQKMELLNIKEADKHFNIENNVVVGFNTKIGKSCTLKNCAIFDYTLIEDNVTIENSIIGWGCHIKSGAKVYGMTVLGEGVVVESNLEIDGARGEPKSIMARPYDINQEIK